MMVDEKTGERSPKRHRPLHRSKSSNKMTAFALGSDNSYLNADSLPSSSSNTGPSTLATSLQVPSAASFASTSLPSSPRKRRLQHPQHSPLASPSTMLLFAAQGTVRFT
jgi:hypothetical protein